MSGLDFDAIRMRQVRDRFGTLPQGERLAEPLAPPRLALPLLCPRCEAVPGRVDAGEADADWLVSYEEVAYITYPVTGLRINELGEVEAIEDETAPADKSDEADYYPERPMGSKHGLIVRDSNCWQAYLVTLVTLGRVVLLPIDDSDTEYNGH